MDPIFIYNELNELNLDILHFNNLWMSQPIFARKWKTIVTLHGDLHLTMPRYCAPSYPFPIKVGYLLFSRIKSLFSSRFVEYLLPVSSYLAESLSNHLGISKEKMRVVYNSVNRDIYKPKQEIGEYMSKIFEEYNISRKNYILHVSNAKPKKNPEALLKAFELISEKYNVNLVIPGKNWKEVKTKSKVKTIGFIPEKYLPELYSNAVALVNPSLHETFGLPFLEAMACGCPVIGSNRTAMPEVIGNAGILLEKPTNHLSVYKAIERLLENPNLREKLSREGIKRAKIFNAKKSAREVFELYKDIAS